MLGLGAGVLLKTLWDLFNKKPDATKAPLPNGSELVISATNVALEVYFQGNNWHRQRFLCSNNTPLADWLVSSGEGAFGGITGNRLVVNNPNTVGIANCPNGQTSGGTAENIARVLRADGSVAWQSNTVTGSMYIDGVRSVNTNERTNWRVRRLSDNTFIPYESTTPGTFAPGTQPQVAPLPATAPNLAPAPLPFLPAPAPLPATVPDRQPVPAPAPAPGGLPQIAPSIAPSIAPARSPGIAPAPAPAQPQPQPVPAVGPLPATAAPLVPVTPSEAVLIDGQLVGGPGQSPAPNLVSIAQEVGRLERKSELLMGRPENGGPGELAENSLLQLLLELLQRLVDELLNDMPEGSYELCPPCKPKLSNGECDSDVVEWPESTNALTDLRRRVDAIATLIQFHKNQGQPGCATPIYGEEVTVHFESP